jgi:tRNA-binding protein
LKELENKNCIAVINLGDKQIGPIMSQCLVLGSISSNGDVLLLKPDINAKLGDKIS